jgi:hypothetical protein
MSSYRSHSFPSPLVTPWGHSVVWERPIRPGPSMVIFGNTQYIGYSSSRGKGDLPPASLGQLMERFPSSPRQVAEFTEFPLPRERLWQLPGDARDRRASPATREG